MIFKLSFLVLIFTTPFLSGAPIFGLPTWIIASFITTLVYAIMIILSIEIEWDTLKEDTHE